MSDKTLIKELGEYIDHLFNTDNLEACDLVNRAYVAISTNDKKYTEAEHQDIVQEKLRQQREACVLSIKRNHSWQELKSAIRNAKID